LCVCCVVAVMILLDFNNGIIFETLKEHLSRPADRREGFDVTLADFDGVQVHIVSPADNLAIVNISLRWRCIGELLANGGREEVKKIYGSHMQENPEEGYDLTFTLQRDSVSGAEVEKTAERYSYLKRNVLSQPFLRIFKSVANKSPITGCTRIQYRDDESFYIKTEGDRAMVVYSIRFRDPDDQKFAKVFLSEFADARKSMRGVPSVTFSQRDPPLDLQGVDGVESGDNVGFVSFVLFDQHLVPNNINRTINLVQIFRNYLHYHIKCSKAYLHDRMRTRVEQWLQVINRARPEVEKEKKLMSGKTFVRK